ncbi:hypothetical protein BH10PSE12_BH10PSE12_08030 [soil metagenome]
MDQHLLTLFIYASDAAHSGPIAREAEAWAITQKLRRTSAEIAEATRIIVQETRVQLQQSGVAVSGEAPVGIDLLDNDYQVALYTGAPELAFGHAYAVQWNDLPDLVSRDSEEPHLIAALQNNATREVSTLSLEWVELHDGSLMLSGKVIIKHLTTALLAAVLGSYGQPIAADQYAQWLAAADTRLVQAVLRQDPTIGSGACAVKLGYVLDLELLTSHARLAYDYESAETAELARLRVCNLQVALYTLGYPISAIDGVAGPNTVAAWHGFREKAGVGRDEPPVVAYKKLLHAVAEQKAERAREIAFERKTSHR